MYHNEYIDASSLSKEEVKALTEHNALAICSELSAKVGALADEACVEDIVAGFTSKPVTIYSQQSQERLVLYIDVYAAIRDFTIEEKRQCSRFNRSPDAARELQRMLADTAAILAIAAQSGMAELIIDKDSNCNFCDDICLAGMTKPCGVLLVCLTLLPAKRGPALVKREMTRAHKVDIPDFFRRVITNRPQDHIKLEKPVSIFS
ncbi:MAG: hypothetical protein IAA31_04225 [Candidatus Anaerobiospirillum merdipullorum]|uniref:Uncharacterized protein n=1 Tax=Candidatus Anaerobiospirillum merdipullorum TaxID=2838450 RepID=A0A9E2KNL5_9GAMM|nr:hypothetical protein [Candidatus Anaerobiospirillum merdipullorum]